MALKRVKNWKKRPGLDCIHMHGFWLKYFQFQFSLSTLMVLSLQQVHESLLPLLLYGRTSLVMKNVAKGNTVNNYCPITCLSSLWKFFSRIPYSLNFLRVKIFADFVVLSQTVKILTLKYVSKYTFSLRNTLSPQKFYPKDSSTAKFSLSKILGYKVIYQMIYLHLESNELLVVEQKGRSLR